MESSLTSISWRLQQGSSAAKHDHLNGCPVQELYACNRNGQDPGNRHTIPQIGFSSVPRIHFDFGPRFVVINVAQPGIAHVAVYELTLYPASRWIAQEHLPIVNATASYHDDIASFCTRAINPRNPPHFALSKGE